MPTAPHLLLSATRRTSGAHLRQFSLPLSGYVDLRLTASQVIVAAALSVAVKALERPKAFTVEAILQAVWENSFPTAPKMLFPAELTREVTTAELVMLVLTSFEVDVVLPHTCVFEIFQHSGLSLSHPELFELVWSLCTDCLRTTALITQQPRQLAAGCIFAACAIASVPLPAALLDMEGFEPAATKGAPQLCRV